VILKNINHMAEAKAPLSNIQLELLKLYATDIPDEQLAELKDLIADFFAAKAVKSANKVWEEKNYNSGTMEEWLNKDVRKSSNSSGH
jgi:hypothetical protein